MNQGRLINVMNKPAVDLFARYLADIVLRSTECRCGMTGAGDRCGLCGSSDEIAAWDRQGSNLYLALKMRSIYRSNYGDKMGPRRVRANLSRVRESIFAATVEA
jgi:hypothetical protein